MSVQVYGACNAATSDNTTTTTTCPTPSIYTAHIRSIRPSSSSTSPSLSAARRYSGIQYIYIYDSYARQHTHHTHISYMHAGGIADYNSTPSRFVYVVNCVWTMQYRRFVKIHWQSASERNTIDLCPPYIKHTQYTHIAHTHTTKTTTTRATTSAVLPVACIRVLRTLRTSRAVCQPVTLHGPSVSSVSSVGRHIFFFVCCFVVIPHTHRDTHSHTQRQ